MIDVTVLYPNEDGARFDFEYWTTKHFPLLRELLGEALLSATAERGLSGPMPGSEPAFVAAAHLRFASQEAFLAAFRPHVGAIMADVAQYTSVSPTVQISEVLI